MPTTEFAKAVLSAQQEFLPVAKTAENAHFHNKFVPLADLMKSVLPILNKHKLALLQFPTTTSEGHPGLCTMLLHESGDNLSDVMPLMLGKSDPQGQGSAITYARRYAVMAVLGVVGDEDDDAEKATTRVAPQSLKLKKAKDDLRAAIKAAKASGSDFTWVATATDADIPSIEDHIQALKAVTESNA